MEQGPGEGEGEGARGPDPGCTALAMDSNKSLAFAGFSPLPSM